MESNGGRTALAKPRKVTVVSAVFLWCLPRDGKAKEAERASFQPFKRAKQAEIRLNSGTRRGRHALHACSGRAEWSRHRNAGVQGRECGGTECPSALWVTAALRQASVSPLLMSSTQEPPSVTGVRDDSKSIVDIPTIQKKRWISNHLPLKIP